MCGRYPLFGFVACRIVGTNIGFSHGSTLRGGVLGYYGTGRRDEMHRREVAQVLRNEIIGMWLSGGIEMKTPDGVT